MAAAASAGVETTSIDAAIVQHHDESVERSLSSQLTDAASPGYGALPKSTRLYTASGAAGLIEACMSAYLYHQSRSHESRLLPSRNQLAAQFLERIQHPDRTIDLLETNFDSTPDTSFVMYPLCTATCLAKRNRHAELFALLAPFLRQAAGALTLGGIHTPDHRWVVSSALA